jgi:hypothetical protein
MSFEDRAIDPALSGQNSPDSFPAAARRDPALDAVVSGSRRYAAAARPSTPPHDLPQRLIDAWSHWAALRLS